MKRQDFVNIGIRNRARIIAAALDLWESGGEKAVTARAVGDKCGITGQRVQQVFKSMDALRNQAAAQAVNTGRQGVIDRMRSEGRYHPVHKDHSPDHNPGNTE